MCCETRSKAIGRHFLLNSTEEGYKKDLHLQRGEGGRGHDFHGGGVRGGEGMNSTEEG